MAKSLVHKYKFNPATNTVVIDYIYKPERFLIITNVTQNQTIFLFNDSDIGLESISYDYAKEKTTLVLKYDCSGMLATDKLQIFVEADQQQFEPSPTLLDPVSKFRVSQPENLIDTDFEYGLQSTKWETLEMVKNIPTFFSRSGDTDLAIESLTTVNGSDVVTVITKDNNSFSTGTPVIVIGTKNITCDGTFVITSVIDAKTFQYKAKSIQNFTGSILSDGTQVFPGSVYQGTEFDLTGINAINTDQGSESLLTVNTLFPTVFEPGTSFFLSNSVGQINLDFDASLVEPENFNAISNTRTNNDPTGEEGFSIGSVQPYNFTGPTVLYFRNSQITVDPTTSIESITFPTEHGFTDNQFWMYVPGEGNTVIGGMVAYTAYVVRVISPNAIYLTTTLGGTTRLNLTGNGTDGGVMRSAFIKAYRMTAVNTTSEVITFGESHGIPTNSNQPVLFFPSGGTASNLASSTSLHTPATLYYTRTTTATTTTVSTAPNGANFDLTSTTATGIMVPVVALTDANTLYFPQHGLLSNTEIVFTVVSGTAPGGLVSTETYKAEPIGTDRVRFKNNDTQAIINLTSIGTAVSVYSIAARTPILNNDTIFAPIHPLRDGLEIFYDAQGGTVVPGLVDNDLYYVFQRTQDTFKLATTPSGWKTIERPFSQSTQVNLTTDVITTGTHGFTTGDAVQYLSATPMGGLTNGAFYWARAVSATTVTLHWTKAGAIANNDRVNVSLPNSGNGTLRAAFLVDITGVGVGTQSFKAFTSNASDGVYTLEQQIDSRTFTLSSNSQIPERQLPLGDSRVFMDLSRSMFRFSAHGLVTGTAVRYETTGTVLQGLTDEATYFVIRINRNTFQLAATAEDANLGQFITIENLGSGDHSLFTTSISGETTGAGTISIVAESDRVIGVDTNFSAIFTPGDIFIVYTSETITAKTVTSINTTSNFLTSAAHGLVDGSAVIMDATTTAPGGTVNGYIYYARTTDRALPLNEFTLHPTFTDAINGINTINLTSAGSGARVQHIADVGVTIPKVIKYVNGTTDLVLTDSVDQSITAANFAVGTALFVRADGFALHRPFDGGVELIPSTNPDATIIRQTRKYFRYQSGKGIQVSFAVNFSPTVTFEQLFVSSESLTTATATTRFPHRLTPGIEITVTGADLTGGVDRWNGVHTVTAVIDPYTFQYELSGVPTDLQAGGIVEFYVNQWQNSNLKCGLYDDQNGLYFEYNGNSLNCCRRSSVQQISGTVSVTFKSGEVVGNGTKFITQLTVNDKLVIKGQTYVITEIVNNTLLYILPSYRGISSSNVIVSKTVDTKVAQQDWNIDRCDGTGPSGFVLDINKIQMAYMDYSWYGAGKVRFGFKDQDGEVVYVHEFVHNNKFTESYMRSGNLPGRYEVENVGIPTFVPSLAHWGTSVIMDGRYDDDKAYVFTASSNTLSITGSASITVSARVETLQQYSVFANNQFRTAGHALLVATPSAALNNIPANVLVTGAGIQANTRTRLPQDNQISPRQPYLPSVLSRAFGIADATRNLLLIDRQPTLVAGANSNYTVTLSGLATPVVYDQPMISIRLAPSVDTGTPGALGQREIINRMQLILDSVGVLSTHGIEVSLVLNGQLNNNNWQRVQNPSLSQLIYHSTADTINGGTVVYNFRAQGGTGTTARTPVITTADLGDIATLGNSILGGDGTYPDGPDVLTIVVRLLEDPSTVGPTNPLSVTARCGWSESQA
jgi:hypothetical protein